MRLLYTAGIYLYALAVRLAAPFNSKARDFVQGRRGLMRKFDGLFDKGDRIVWIHCASLGEFEQGRPVIERLRAEHPGYKLLLTFFSPSGYRIRRNYEAVDAVVYMPLDTPRNARAFLDAVRPEIAIFVKYEFWLNFLGELGRRPVRTYIVSAIFRPDSVFFRPYGRMFRRALGAFDTIFVQNEESRQLLAGIGVRNVDISGDTRFDRVAAIPDNAPGVPVAANFAAGADVMIAGSTWPPDEELLLPFMAAHPELKFILAPHEPDNERINRMIEESPFEAARYSLCTPEKDMSGVRLLVIDTIGLLSSLYRYGKYAYIGGGFGVGIHNTLEAATFGLPVAFGPNYSKFQEAKDLIRLGCAVSVTTTAGLEEWYGNLSTDPAAYATARAKALSYISANKGATEKILGTIFPTDSPNEG